MDSLIKNETLDSREISKMAEIEGDSNDCFIPSTYLALFLHYIQDIISTAERFQKWQK